MKIFLNSTVAISLMVFLTSCAGLTQKFDAENAQKIKSVAVVAVEIHQGKPTDNMGLSAFSNLMNGKVDHSKNPTNQTMAKNVIANFNDELAKKTKWNVKSIQEVTSNQTYKNKFTTAMSGTFRTTMMTSDKYDAIYPDQFLDVAAFRKMPAEERLELAKSLGVDAIIELIVYQDIQQSMFDVGHISGDGIFSYIATANMQLFMPQFNAEPVWRSQNVKGLQSKLSSDLPAKFNKEEKFGKLGEEASASAIQNILNNYTL